MAVMNPIELYADLAPVRTAVAVAARRVAAAGLAIGTSGNLSLRAGEHVAITPTGAVLADLDPDEVTIVNGAGEMLAGRLKPTSELDLHLGVYARYGAGAVVHTHPPLGTALGCVLDVLPCIHYAMLAFGGDVRVAPYRTFGSPALAEATLEALDGRAVALMANHGAIAVGEDLDRAVGQAELLEWACRLYIDAAALGTPRSLSDTERTAVIEAAIARNYGSTQEATAP